MGTFSGTLCLSVPGLLSVGVTRTLAEFLGTLSQLIQSLIGETIPGCISLKVGPALSLLRVWGRGDPGVEC